MRITSHIRNNVIGYIALFFALCGVAYAGDGPLPGQNQVGSDDIINGEVFGKDIQPGTIGSGKIVDNSLTASDLAAHSVGFYELDPLAFAKNDIAPTCVRQVACFFQLPPDAVQSGEIQDGQVMSSDIQNGGVSKADLAADAAPDGYSAFDDDTGIICNAFCTEGSLKNLPAGSYAISGKIQIRQDDSGAPLAATCKLIAGADFDFSQGFVAPDGPSRLTIPMQVVHTFASNDSAVSLDCKDSDFGNTLGNNLKITAIRLGSLSNVHSSSASSR